MIKVEKELEFKNSAFAHLYIRGNYVGLVAKPILHSTKVTYDGESVKVYNENCIVAIFNCDKIHIGEVE